MKLVLILWGMISLLSSCNSDVYISDGGTDTGDCSSSLNACATWSYSISQLSTDGNESLIVDANTVVTVDSGLSVANGSYTIIGQDSNTSILSLKTNGELFAATMASIQNIVIQMDTSSATLATTTGDVSEDEVHIDNVRIVNSSHSSSNNMISGNAQSIRIVDLTMANTKWSDIVFSNSYNEITIDGLYITGTDNSLSYIAYIINNGGGEVCPMNFFLCV